MNKKICEEHNIPLTRSIGWYGEKYECQKCLIESHTLNGKNIFHQKSEGWLEKAVEQCVESRGSHFPREAFRIILREALEVGRREAIEMLQNSGFIIGYREGDAFKEYGWDEVHFAKEKLKAKEE